MRFEDHEFILCITTMTPAFANDQGAELARILEEIAGGLRENFLAPGKVYEGSGTDSAGNPVYCWRLLPCSEMG